MPAKKDLPTILDLTNGDPQTIADQCGIPVIWTDHQATRRQRLHGMNTPGGAHAYTSTHINEVLDQLAREGFAHGVLICETPRRKHLACYIDFHPLSEA